MARGPHALTASPRAPELACQRADPHAPNLTWKSAVRSTNINWCFFQLLPSPNQPPVSRLACPLVQSGRLVVPRRGHCPSSSSAGQRYHQQPNRDTSSCSPITDLSCLPCLGEAGWGQGRWGHRPATMPPSSAPSLLSLGATSPRQQVQLQQH